MLGDVSQGLQIAFDDGIHEQTCLLFRIPMRHIHHVGFDHSGSRFPIYKRLLQIGDGSIIVEPVISPHDAEAQNMLLLVQNVQSLGAGSCRETRDDLNLSQAADLDLQIPLTPYGAVADELLVDLRLVEAPHQRPDHAQRRLHSLDHHR